MTPGSAHFHAHIMQAERIANPLSKGSTVRATHTHLIPQRRIHKPQYT